MITKERYKEQINLKLNEFGIDKAKENKSYLLEYPEYVPLNEEEFNFCLKIYPKLEKIAAEIGHVNFVASMSFVNLGKGKNEPVFWDLYGLRELVKK